MKFEILSNIISVIDLRPPSCVLQHLSYPDLDTRSTRCAAKRSMPTSPCHGHCQNMDGWVEIG